MSAGPAGLAIAARLSKIAKYTYKVEDISIDFEHFKNKLLKIKEKIEADH